MKALQFTVINSNNDSVVVDEDVLPYLYNYLHRHNEIQITLIIKGEGNLITGNYTQPFKPGDVYIIGSDQPHMFQSAPSYFNGATDERVHAIHLLFDYDKVLRNLINLPELELIKKFIYSINNGLQVPFEHLPHIATKIHKVSNATGIKRLLLFIKLLQYLAKEVKNCKSLTTGITNQLVPEQEGIRMHAVYQYTLNHLSENITLESIASVAYMTPQAFCKYFKKHTRKTYITFLNEIRINEACKKIMKGEIENISSIAYAFGFNSPINFNRVFKKVTGMAPSQYIKTYKLKGPNFPSSFPDIKLEADSERVAC